MKLTSIFLISVLFLSSCTIDWNDEKSSKITNLEATIVKLQKEKLDDLFAKKESCLRKYKETWDVWNQQTYDDLSIDVFYSQAGNTCLIALDGWYKKDKTRVFLLGDLFSLNVLHSFSVDKDWKVITKKDVEWGTLKEIKCDFNKNFKKLKAGKDDYFNVECP